MIVLGLFEAKAKLSELCDQVAKRREPVLITRRGKPLVVIEPVLPGKAASSSVWNRRANWEKKHGPIKEEFEVPKRARQTWRDPLED